MVKEHVLALAIFWLVFATSGTVVAAEHPLAGVWQGTLGKTAIRACFGRYGTQGNYYYLRYQTPIALNLKNKIWHEAKDTGLWQLSTPVGDSVAGSWSTASGNKTLPLQLHRLTRDEQCGAEVYVKPLIKPLHWQQGPWQTWQDTRFRVLQYGADTTIELDANLPQAKRINTWLTSQVLADKAVAHQRETMREGLARYGHIAYDETRVEPVFINQRWLGIRFYRWHAFTGRNGINMHNEYFSLLDGKPFVPWSWFIELKPDSGYQHRLPKPLAEQWESKRKDDECSSSPGYYHLSLKDNGLWFWEEAMGDGCEREFFITPEQAIPYANKEGKKQLTAFAALLSTEVNRSQK